MDDLYSLISTLCFSAFISGVVLNFVNTKHTAKVIRLVAVLYMISSLLSGEFTVPDLYVTDDNSYVQGYTRDDYVIESAAEIIRQNAEKRLKEKNISYENIEVHINKEKDKVSIERIIVFQPDQVSAQKTAEALMDIISADKIIIEDYNDKLSG